ncbi:MAG: type II toxin-antitoxin system HicB family antitoxin [Caldilineaceae bacterium]
MNPTDYPIIVRPLPQEDGGGYLVTFPDLPGCMADGETPEEAIQNGFDAASSWLKTAQEYGDPIPAPSKPEDNQLMTQVPQSLYTRLTTRAQAEGVSMNALVVTYLAEGLSRQEAHQIH